MYGVILRRRGKAIIATYSECRNVALVMRMRRIMSLSVGFCLAVLYHSTLSHK
jgi:hypothetical protein